MKLNALDICYHNGKPMIGYIELAGDPARKSARTEVVAGHFTIDYDAFGMPIGIEVLHPRITPIQDLEKLIDRFHVPPIDLTELKSIQATLRPVEAAA